MLNAMTIEPFKCCPLTCVQTQPHGTTNKPQWRSRIIGWNVRTQEVCNPVYGWHLRKCGTMPSQLHIKKLLLDPKTIC